VEEIDIIKNEYIVGFVTFSGIINVITKAGDFSNVPLPRNAVRIRYRDRDYGFKFKYPDYSSDDKKNDRIPDFRNTLYWNPDLKPDKNGKILIDITTSDFISDYEINLQGAAGGKLFSNRKTIKVE
jgi:heme/copper-type cytochrome/quinol oxidase subunit 2